MSDPLIIPDVSEHQGDVDWNAFTAAGNNVAIARVYNGLREDRSYKANRQDFWAAGGRLLGLYAYLIPSRDAASQAADYLTAVGTLKDGEFAILDVEEGTGDQAERARTWRGIVEAQTGRPAFLYSGQYYWRDQGLGGAGFTTERTWIAAYNRNRPTWPPHGLWQFTDSYGPMPGISSAHDASYFYGTADDLATLIGSTGPGSSTGHRDIPEKATPQPYPGSGAFILGKSNAAVTQLGIWLTAKGYGRYYRVGPGPVFGQADLEATRQFQKDQGWTGSGADGYPGPETWRRLQL